MMPILLSLSEVAARLDGADDSGDGGDEASGTAQQTQQQQQQEKRRNLVNVAGGKAASLARLMSPSLSGFSVPTGYVLTTEFFRDWVNRVVASPEYRRASEELEVASASASASASETVSASASTTTELVRLCDNVKTYGRSLDLSSDQREVIERLREKVEAGGDCCRPRLLAVRSSAPDEDGAESSFAGMFETRLGIEPRNVLDAVRDCFTSLFDYRVFRYRQGNGESGLDGRNRKPLAFAVVVMEMVESKVAGVAFGVNPINSDLDEMAVDCSWGLGETVVDGSVAADHYVYHKIEKRVVEVSIGSKEQESRLFSLGGGDERGVRTVPVDNDRREKRTLSDGQLGMLCDVLCLIEGAYGVPMDVEFAFVEGDGDGDDRGGHKDELTILQARPITTNYTLDKDMITAPGERRALYYDFNIASEATTTEPFTHLDMKLYCRMSAILMGAPAVDLFAEDPKMLMFVGSTRPYINLSIALRWFSPRQLSGWTRMMDAYLSSTFDSTDCDRKRYMAAKTPKEINLRNALGLIRQFGLWSLWKRSRKYRAHPNEAKKEYMKIVRACLSQLKDIHRRGVGEGQGIKEYTEELIASLMPALNEEIAVIYYILLPTFHKLDRMRREGANEEIRQEYEALCGGFVGDPLMEINIAMYKLAKALPYSIWSEYDHSSFDKLANRIQDNIEGNREDDLPGEFLEAWKSFMDVYGYDGMPQLFASSERYVESPEILLAKMSHNVSKGIKDPVSVQERNVERRREAMSLREARAKKCRWWNPLKLSSIRRENEVLEHLMWIRNVPKMNISYAVGMIREAVLSVESDLIRNKRLEETGDILHLDIKEIDAAMISDSSMDLMELVRRRKAVYKRAKREKQCPILVDSRNRILRPDVAEGEQEPGILVGAAISPGVATGRARLVHDPTDVFEAGEVLVAVVTDPAWTPLFVGAAAIVLQVGGVLQHGALCAREYGKPGVSGIDVRNRLETGMMVSVDGNLGTVKILEEEKAAKGALS